MEKMLNNLPQIVQNWIVAETKWGTCKRLLTEWVHLYFKGTWEEVEYNGQKLLIGKLKVDGQAECEYVFDKVEGPSMKFEAYKKMHPAAA